MYTVDSQGSRGKGKGRPFLTPDYLLRGTKCISMPITAKNSSLLIASTGHEPGTFDFPAQVAHCLNEFDISSNRTRSQDSKFYTMCMTYIIDSLPTSRPAKSCSNNTFVIIA